MERKPGCEKSGIGLETVFNGVELFFEVPTDEVLMGGIGVLELNFGTLVNDKVGGERGGGA